MEGKGQQYALKSFAPLAKEHPLWKLRFVGSDMGMKKNSTYKESLVKLATRLNIHDQVEWAGFEEDVFREYESASIVLNFSESESFSLTCLEAMATGRCVIATNSGGPAEIIVHQQNGILVPVGNISAMTNAMDYLIANPEIREKMSNEARNHVTSTFSPVNTTLKLRALYMSVRH
jgi:glycosyltransferase involved in cell wall biosynthesis